MAGDGKAHNDEFTSLASVLSRGGAVQIVPSCSFADPHTATKGLHGIKDPKAGIPLLFLLVNGVYLHKSPPFRDESSVTEKHHDRG